MTFAEAVRSAIAERMRDSRTHILGLGASYPNGLDGTMGDLAQIYSDRVHDTPCSEASVTGAAVGMAINGLKPIVHHGRMEFALYAMDAILTQAAKWNYMFGGDYPCPLTVRIAMGRQWGNGPQHTFTTKGIFAVPGLKVVAPADPYSARELLLLAGESDCPVIFLESRWLYKTKQTLDNKYHWHKDALGMARIMRAGSDVTIVAMADMVLESLKAAKLLETVGVSAEVIDLVSVYPIDYATIGDSIGKTRAFICVDASTSAYSVAHEILSRIDGYTTASVTCPDYPCPTSPALTKDYYPTPASIATRATLLLNNPYAFPENSTFAELNLPPTDNFDTLLV